MSDTNILPKYKSLIKKTVEYVRKTGNHADILLNDGHYVRSYEIDMNDNTKIKVSQDFSPRLKKVFNWKSIQHWTIKR